MANKTSIMLFSLLLLPNLVIAEAYRYQDENGQTVYTQNPPTNVNATPIKPPPPPASSGIDEKAAIEKKVADDKLAEIKAQKDQELAAINAMTEEEKHENCLKARQQLANLQLRNRVKMIGPDGQATMLSETQKKEQIAKTQADIKAYCTKPLEQ